MGATTKEIAVEVGNFVGALLNLACRVLVVAAAGRIMGLW